MTTDEIKQSVSMREVVEQYGYHPNRAGFISCPFHNGDRTPSMKIYQKDFHCHACGANGDIFTFVQQMDGCSFKEAYLKLGGEYEKKSDWQRKKFQYQLQQKKERQRRELLKKREQKMQVINDIKLYRNAINNLPVFSENWCYAVNNFEYAMYELEELTREGVTLVD